MSANKALITGAAGFVGSRLAKRPLDRGDTFETLAYISKANELLGYAPAFRVEAGIQHFVEWCRNGEAGQYARAAHS